MALSKFGLHVLVLMLAHPLFVMIMIMPLSWYDVITIVHGSIKGN